MKKMLLGLFTVLAVSMLCMITFSQSVEAKPQIRYHVEKIQLDSPGEATIVGHFSNDGDETGYVKWMDLDLTLIADNGQQMWADTGIRHYVEKMVPAYEMVHYTFYIQNGDIPEYQKKFRWKCHSNTHWEKNAG
ncbi:MAG: hypothetical protein J6M33_04090 [Anaerovibrio sp.]|nr:hypothetical protein [Anaerovibrio sp.]